MGRKSTKKDKSIYQITREEKGLTREKASERMEGISPERIEKIENGRVRIQPYDVKEMAKGYQSPLLCNYYCTHECDLGKEKVTILSHKELTQIAVETLTALNKLNKKKERFLEIVEDDKLTSDEYEDFVEIKKTLDCILVSVETMQLWIDEKIAQGKLDKELFR